MIEDIQTYPLKRLGNLANELGAQIEREILYKLLRFQNSYKELFEAEIAPIIDKNI